MKSRLCFFSGLIAFAAVKVTFAAADLTASLEFIGNPQMERWPNNATARACLDLQFYQGRLFNGGGEVESNPGAPWISSIDPFDNSTRFEFAPGTEAIANYRIASWGDLLASAQDPHEGDANLGHVFTRTPDGKWSIFKSVGGSLTTTGSSTVANNTHCWDIEEFDGRVFVAGYNLVSSTDRCKTFSACTDLTSAYVSIVYATSKTKTLSDNHLRRQIQLLRFGDTALFAVPNTLLQPNVMNDTRTCKQEVFRYDLSTHKFAVISQRASDIYPDLSSSDYQLVGRNLTYFSTDTYARTLARIWHTTPFKDRVLYVGCYDTPPYSSVVSPWEDKIALTSYPLPLMGCSAAVVNNQIKATRISFGNDKTNYPWDFAVVGDTVYALTSRYVADGQKNHHIVWKSTDGVNFTEVFSFDFHQNFISLEYRDGWFYLGVGCKDATKGYTYDKTADESGSIYRVRCPQEPIQVVSSADTLEIAEGSSATVTFKLSAQPASNVTLRVGATLANSRFTTDKTALTFTTANWATPQEVTVSVAGNGTLDANRSGAVVCGAPGFDVERGEFYSAELASGTISTTFTDAELVAPANGEIRTADDFYCAMAYPDGDYKLMADIDLEGSLFTTIDEFTGTLNGNGFTLSGLGDGPIAKRFSGVVKNLTLDGEGAEVKGLSRGLFFDEANGGAFTNCTVKGYTLKAETSDAYLGLFVGVATGPISFCRCSTDANCLLNQANQHDTSLGGFVAKVALPAEGGARIVFESCTNNAAISATDNYRTGSGAGGFVGVINGTLPATPTNEVLFVRCVNEGPITSAGRNNCLGGLVGRFNATYNKKASVDTKFILCANEADITVPENGTQSGSAGGFTGNVGSSNNIIFSQCTSTGTITAPAAITTGPFAAVGETATDDSIADDYPEPPPEEEGGEEEEEDPEPTEPQDLTANLEYVAYPAFVRYQGNNMNASSIIDLQVYHDLIFSGYGNWDGNQGPVTMVPLEPNLKTLTDEGELGTDSTETLRVFEDGNLYVPATDRRESHANRGLFFRRNASGEWHTHTAIVVDNNVSTHFWDMMDFNGRIFLAGYGLASSSDGGTTWSRVESNPQNTRYLGFIKCGDELFCRDQSFIAFDYKTGKLVKGITNYNSYYWHWNKSTSLFDKINNNDYTEINGGVDRSSWALSNADLTNYATTSGHPWHCTPFKDRSLYILGSASAITVGGKKCAPSGTFPAVLITAWAEGGMLKGKGVDLEGAYPYDLTVFGDAIYALTFKYKSGSQTVEHAVWKSTDGETFTKILFFDFQQVMASIEYHNGYFYFGVAHLSAQPLLGTLAAQTDLSGRIYRVWCPQEKIQVVATPVATSVNEGASTQIGYKLSAKPESDVTLVVSRTDGNANFTVTLASLTFTPSNWNVAQNVTVSLADTATGDATTAAITCGVATPDSVRGAFASESVTASSVVMTPVVNDFAPTVASVMVQNRLVPASVSAALDSFGAENGVAKNSATLVVTAYSDAGKTQVIATKSASVTALGESVSVSFPELEPGRLYYFDITAKTTDALATVVSRDFMSPIATREEDLVDLTDDVTKRESVTGNSNVRPYDSSGAWDNTTSVTFGGYKRPNYSVYEFTEPTVANGFGLLGIAGQQESRMPLNYSFAGSNDTNGEWTVLFAVTNAPVWGAEGEWRRHLCDNTTAYRFYKVSLDENRVKGAGDAHVYSAEAELYFIGESETPPEEPEEPVGLNNLGAPEGDRFELSLQQTWPAADYGAEVCLWQYDRYAALSFGHDDNCAWDIPFLLREAERNGIKLTWWLITANVGQSDAGGTWEKWRECFAAGHGIESHSHTHEWHGGGRTVPDAAAAAGMSEADYVEFCMYSNSLAVIRENIPGCKPSTLAFPGGESYPEIANRYFVSGRSVNPYINRANAIDYRNVSASSSGIDPGYINAMLGGRGGSKALAGWKGSFNNEKNYRGWFVPFQHTESTHDGLPNAGHEEGVSQQIERMALLGRHRRHLWLGTYGAVAKYGQSRDTASLTVGTKTASRITFTLQDQMRDDWYDEPLTVKVRLPAVWAQSGVAATQGDKTLDAFYVEHGDAKYALVNAVPDRGEVTLVPAAANSGTWDETSYEQPTYTYQVTFFDTDGTTALKRIIAHPINTSAAELAPVLYKPGYKLSWTTADGVSIDNITDDVDFTAVWAATDEKPRAIFVDDSTGEQLSAVDTVYGSRPAQPTDLPAREGYIAYWEPELGPIVSNTQYWVKYMRDDDPIPGAIIVRTAEEFCDAMVNHPDAVIRMVRDIDISGYGYTAVPEFCGTFKAYGHVLTGLGAESLCVTNSGSFVGLKVLGDSDAEHPVLASGYGVFAVVSDAGVFTDCRVDGYAIRANAQNLAYGVFVGTALKGTAFTNCTVGATCSINQGGKPNNEIGGFVGELKVTDPSGTLITFAHCTNEAPIFATGDYNTAHGDGGFIGRATGCGAEVNPEIVFVNCAGTGLVSSSGGNSNLGGYIGNVPGLTAKSTCKVIIEGGTTTMPVGEKAKNIGEWIGLGANVIVEHKEYIPPEPPEEPPEEPVLAPRPVARWDVVPYQRFDGVFKAGVVAFHEDGVKVTFTYAGRTYVAENPVYNDRVKVWEYFVPIDASTLPDGDVVISATATSLGVTPVSFELPQLTLYANHGGTVGSTNSITVCPTNSLKDAITSVGDGGTVYLKAGTYSLNGFGDKTGRKYWTTLRPAEGVMRGEVKFSSGRPGMDKFRLKDLLLYTDSDGYSAIIMGENGGTVCWLDNCKFTCVGGRYRGNSNLFGNKMGGFVTGGVTEGMNNGPGGSLIRDHYVHSIAADTWTGSERLVVNCHVDDVDPGSSGAHPDFFQSHAVEPEWCHDVILYNVSGWSCKSQGLFGWRLKDAAFVNIVFHLEGGNFTSQFSGDLDNVLFAHLTLVDQTWNWREGFFPKNVRSVNGVYGNMIVYGHETMKTDGSTGLTVDHNAFYGKKSKTSAAESDWGSNDVAIGRDFADEAAHDYSLVDGSAGLVNGIHLQCVPADLNGNLYPSGARPCGAYTTPALATAIAKVWNDDWDKSGEWHDGDSEIETNDWFNVEFEDAGYKAGSDWTKTSADKSGGTWSGDDGGATTLDGTAFVVTLTDTFEGELRYTPSKASDADADVVVEGSMEVSEAAREIRPEGVPFALTFENHSSGNLTPVAYIGGAWHSFGTTGFAADAWVDWKVEVDQTSTNAPRIQVTVAKKGGAVETSGWIAGGFAAKQVSALSYIGVGSFGDFRARYLTVKGGEVIELVTPEFAADGSALGFRSGQDEARMFTLKITNPVKGAYYTVLTSTKVEGPYLPEGDSVLFDQDSGTLTLEVSADTPQKFAKILVSLEPCE